MISPGFNKYPPPPPPPPPNSTSITFIFTNAERKIQSIWDHLHKQKQRHTGTGQQCLLVGHQFSQINGIPAAKENSTPIWPEEIKANYH
jgi:hypothetical protein